MHYVERGYGYIEKLRARMADDPREKMKLAVMQAEIDIYNEKADSEEVCRTIKSFMEEYRVGISDSRKVKYLELINSVKKKIVQLTLKKAGKFSSQAMPEEDWRHYQGIHE